MEIHHETKPKGSRKTTGRMADLGMGKEPGQRLPQDSY